MDGYFSRHTCALCHSSAVLDAALFYEFEFAFLKCRKERKAVIIAPFCAFWAPPVTYHHFTNEVTLLILILSDYLTEILFVSSLSGEILPNILGSWYISSLP